MEIKVITLWQPWASLMALRAKGFETRSWPTNYRGLIAVHSAQRYQLDQDNFFWKPAFRAALAERGVERPDDLPFGKILSVHELRDVFRTEDIRKTLGSAELEFGNYMSGRFAWEMPLVYRLPKPIPARGYQGLWHWELPTELEDEVNQLGGL